MTLAGFCKYDPHRTVELKIEGRCPPTIPAPSKAIVKVGVVRPHRTDRNPRFGQGLQPHPDILKPKPTDTIFGSRA